MRYAFNLPMQRDLTMLQCEDELKKTIVAIDDAPENLLLIMEILKMQCNANCSVLGDTICMGKEQLQRKFQ